jgi:hypothetical protein
MRPLGLVLALLCCALLAGGARSAACSPLDCSTSQFAFAHGSLLGVRGNAQMPLRVIDLRTGETRWRLPPGVVAGHVLVHQDGPLLTWFDAASGARLADAVVQARGTFVLTGASQDGTQAVLARTQQRSTTFAIVSPDRERVVKLGGNRWSFDALNGDSLFLVRTLHAGYRIRLLRLASGVLERTPLKDPKEAATLTSVPWSRTSSADGRYLYTLYVGPNGDAMVHVLDTQAATARCVDLPGTGDFNAASTYAIVVDPDGRHLWAVSPGYGRVAHIDVVAHRVVDAYRFDASAAWNTNFGIAALAPDGERLAVTDGYHVWFVELAQRKVVAGPSHVAIALAYSPDLKRLWVVGERSRVTALRAQ